LNRTSRKHIWVFLVFAAFLYPAALPLSFLPLNLHFSLSPIIPDAWAQTEAPPEKPIAQPEEITQQGQGGPLRSAPSTTAPEEQKKPAAGAARQEGEKPSTPSPQEQGRPQVELPQQQGPPPQGGREISAQTPSASATGAESTFVDTMHGGITQSIRSTATWLDSFFGDRRANELNPSYVRFRYNVFLEKGTAPLFDPDLDARLVLPQMREKTHLVISGTPKETNEFSATQSNPTTDQLASTTDRNVTTSLHYAPIETAEQSFVVRGGLKFNTRGVDVTAGPYYRVVFPFQSGWSLRFIEDLAWRSKEGWKSSSVIDLERPLPHDLFFRTSTNWVHTEHVEGFIYALSFSVSQPLSSKAALSYSWVNICQTNPVNELMEVDLRVSYRKRIWRDWLFYEVMPQYRFPRDRAFEATPGILFRIDMFFGNYT
jgi:hypothetical protein